MKFVFVSYSYDPGFKEPDAWFDQIGGYVGILSCLAKNNHEVIRIKQIGDNYTCEVNGVQYQFVNFGARSRHFPRKLHQLLKGLNPDIVVVHGLHNPLQVIQLRFSLPRNVKIMAQNHAEKPSSGIRKVLQRLADRYIGAYLFASKTMGMDWVKRGNLASAKKIHEVMEISSGFYPIDPSLARTKTGMTGDPSFLWVGRLDHNKDPLNVVKAFLRFTDSCPRARLYMIYHTEELLNDIKTILNIHSNGNTVTLVGKKPHDELLYWYNSADFMVSGSHYEGSGTAVCEAMSCGCVPILTNIFSFRAMTGDGRTGLLYEAGNQQQLLAALAKTERLDMTAEREKVLAFFESHLSFEAIAGKFEAIAAGLRV
ncbi:glycosyltransferase family 4 protein [Mucilaginibacter sp. PPCGB 2223]|uniref:glycosyltransferase family 4 protein n=1 Tax=Mucilaginibacter sp. PPCGB 2223 TaxID=1886027 RepID=UPI00158675A4|nr:glycosyltransferase family 4 protein [Mucilaginibacter sp. PPCGB 2223]